MIHLHVTHLKSQADEELQSGILGPLLAYIQSLKAGQQSRHQAWVKEPVIMQPSFGPQLITWSLNRSAQNSR